MTTLLKTVVEASGLSRRKAFAAIREGRVSVRGIRVLDPSAEYAGGALSLDGLALRRSKAVRTYLMLNKPPGFITSRSDELGRRTVLDLVPEDLMTPGLHPVGRLDRETSGLLLLTNDGDLTYALTHPSHEVDKEYWVRLDVPPEDELLEALRDGVEIDGEERRPVRLRRLDDPQFDLSITIREGRNRQVRRMLEALGARVTLLRRVREGPLWLSDLPEGGVRPLTPRERSALGLERAPAAERGRRRR
jgi:23S rRNA pseudouridine2605 synthase